MKNIKYKLKCSVCGKNRIFTAKNHYNSVIKNNVTKCADCKNVKYTVDYLDKYNISILSDNSFKFTYKCGHKLILKNISYMIKRMKKGCSICKDNTKLINLIKLLGKHEEWVFIKNYPKYQISTSGKVISFKGNLLKPQIISSQKREGVMLHNEDGPKINYMSRLMAEHFVPNPRHKRFVMFKDGNHNNYSVDNLYWSDDFGFDKINKENK